MVEGLKEIVTITAALVILFVSQWRGEPIPPPGHQGGESSRGGGFERNRDNHRSSGIIKCRFQPYTTRKRYKIPLF